jgi:membrane fusion protein (multidrug efflux system)
MTETKTCRAAGTAGLSLIAFFILPNAGCGKQAAQGAARTPSPTVVVVVETAERRDVPIMLELAARTEAAATVEVRANVEGRLIEMSFKEGNMVQKGQLLFRIDPRRYEAAVQAAGAAVEKAEADLEMAREQQHLVNAQSGLRQAEAGLLKANQDAERLKPLAARRAVPERDLDAAIAAQSSAGAAVEDARATVRTTTVGDRMGLRQAQASLTAARAALETAELDREGTAIRAPIGGLIGRVEVSVGNYVGRGESNRLATISQLDPIDVDFNMSETHYLSTTTRVVDRAALNRIELTLADNSVYPFRGRFTNIGRAVDEKTGTLPVVAQFPNAKGILLPGMSGRVRIAGETRADAVLVSERALFAAQGSRAVYVVAPGNKAALRSVVTEGSYQGKSIVTKGLSGGETVIVEGIAKVRPGQSVTVQTAQASQDR